MKNIATKFYNFQQNNSGGYFVKDKDNGVNEEIIIEAKNAKEAWERLEKIGDKVDGFFDYCGCCGERWSNWLEDNDGKSEPMHYDTPLNQVEKSIFRLGCFVHYYDKTIKEFIYK
jgi:hypothetical protein